jgi:NAD(P)-dependent dehydrogenase (short-subunit alcohol dehydrogenase family)
MAKRGKGAIVNISTMVADYGVSGMTLYGSSKAAINLPTKSWALNMARAASASIQSALDLHERRARKQWEKVVSNLLRKRRRAVRQQPTRLTRPLFSWRRIARVSVMGQNSASTAGRTAI